MFQKHNSYYKYYCSRSPSYDFSCYTKQFAKSKYRLSTSSNHCCNTISTLFEMSQRKQCKPFISCNWNRVLQLHWLAVKESSRNFYCYIYNSICRYYFGRCDSSVFTIYSKVLFMGYEFATQLKICDLFSSCYCMKLNGKKLPFFMHHNEAHIQLSTILEKATTQKWPDLNP